MAFTNNPGVRVIRPFEHRPQRWKNGGGTTTEILREPAEGAFVFRVSIADVASDGPFSRFDGYDRHIMLLEGAGMHLDCGEHGTIVLTRNEPRAFSGDWDVTGTLVQGPVRDFNLMVDRARFRSTLEVMTAAGLVHADVCILHILAGPGAGDTHVNEGSLVVPNGVTAAIARLSRS
jgi:environmental stress-induced protein Ves